MDHQFHASFEWLLPLAAAVLNYLFITVVIKYIVGKWIASKLTKLLKFFLIKSQRDAVSWIHYREKAMRHGHNYPSPDECNDGVCGSYHASLRKD